MSNLLIKKLLRKIKARISFKEREPKRKNVYAKRKSVKNYRNKKSVKSFRKRRNVRNYVFKENVRD